MDERGEQAAVSTQQLCALHRQVRFCPQLITRPHGHFRDGRTPLCKDEQAATVVDFEADNRGKNVKY